MTETIEICLLKVLEAEKSKIKVQRAQYLSSWFADKPLLCFLTCMRSGEGAEALLCLLMKTLILSGQGSTLMTSFNLCCCLVPKSCLTPCNLNCFLIPNKATLEVRHSTQEFGEMQTFDV